MAGNDRRVCVVCGGPAGENLCAIVDMGASYEAGWRSAAVVVVDFTAGTEGFGMTTGSRGLAKDVAGLCAMCRTRKAQKISAAIMTCLRTSGWSGKKENG